MAQAWHLEISDRTIGKALKKIGFPRKKTYGDRERDEEKRQEFIEKIDRKKPEERVDIDESGIDNRHDYSYGWNEKGQRFYDLKSGKRSIRVSIIASLSES
ncbi:hypothetical protein IQ272_06365 [Chroococcidiopsidales cyanobacterium LEGE 13417]|nr:hypothetical protein [Chroococcidiopsidales cyanobacterium LEGE 13417]